MLNSLTVRIATLATLYSDAKFGLEQRIPFDADWLHLIIGPAILAAASVVMRKPMASWDPWLVVVALGILNELIDLIEGASVAPNAAYFESATDFLLTIAIPTAILIKARFFPRSSKGAGGPVGVG